VESDERAEYVPPLAAGKRDIKRLFLLYRNVNVM
jgi:hypothetical protein